MDIRIEGQQNLHAAYADLKAVGNTELTKALTRAIRDATKPTKDAVRESALASLPKRGGLARLIADSKITNSVKKGSRSAGVTIKATNLHAVAAINKGRLRHPTFGNRKVWRTQSVKPGWFTDPIEKHAPDVRKAVDDACRQIAYKLHN